MENNLQVFELRIPSCANRLKIVRSTVCAAAQMYGFSAADVDSMVLAVNEAAMNIMQHAYGDQCTGEIVLEVIERTGDLVFRLIDFADRVDKSQIRSRDLAEIRPGGLGVHIIAQGMDQVCYLDAPGSKGNIVEMSKKICSKEGA